MNNQEVYNWGQYPKIQAIVYSPCSLEELRNVVTATGELIARGNGRCYGDSSLAKYVVSTLNLNKIIHFDETLGEIECEAGVLLNDILDKIVPHGFFLPVTPGTKLITIGGALASDVHGKNHHLEGSFSAFVRSFRLMNERGEIRQLYPEDDLFWQTAGGLGSTGVIVSVQLNLKKIETGFIKQRSIPAKNFKDVIHLMHLNNTAAYSVAWIDTSSKGEKMGRSVLLLGEHASYSEISKEIKNPLITHKKPVFNVPFYFPSFVMNQWLIRLFNFLFFHKASFAKEKILHYDSFFFPLDAISNWNRIYGKNGFLEYQLVLPDSVAEDGIEKLLKILVDNKSVSFLSVIKKFGPASSGKYLNFPMEGITLAFDLKITRRVWFMLDQMDDIVTSLGGRVYLTKDARLKKEFFRKQYPGHISPGPKFKSHQMIRLQQDNDNVLLVVGANSDIAKEYILLYLSVHTDAKVILASRNQKEMEDFILKNKLKEKSEVILFDVEKTDTHASFVMNLTQKPTEILYAAGFCPTNEECRNFNDIWIKNAMVNYVGAVSILNSLTNDDNPFLRRIIGISSIAGLRGRKSNFMYGSSKSGFHQYLYGLRQELKARNIIVQSVTPGAVRTKMTSHLNLPFFASHPKELARKIMSNKSSFQIYPDWLWRMIAFIVRIAPVRFLGMLR